MRLWSLHPRYLDKVGVVACWSEGLGGLRALQGRQKMHRNHPQLERFKATGVSEYSLYIYLDTLWRVQRSAQLDYSKLDPLVPGYVLLRTLPTLPVTTGQIAYEQWLLYTKLRGRDERAAGRILCPTDEVVLHPMFYSVPGPVEAWERVK